VIPDQHASARITVIPDKHASARITVIPDKHASAQIRDPVVPRANSTAGSRMCGLRPSPG
jgi:hypothetical protein